jgi:hypothetical protein
MYTRHQRVLQPVRQQQRVSEEITISKACFKHTRLQQLASKAPWPHPISRDIRTMRRLISNGPFSSADTLSDVKNSLPVRTPPLVQKLQRSDQTSEIITLLFVLIFSNYTIVLTCWSTPQAISMQIPVFSLQSSAGRTPFDIFHTQHSSPVF